jgi:CheY-like chemotaxis protein
MIKILIVEDNPGDVGLTQAAFEKSNIPTTLHVVNDGDAAMSYLRDNDEPRPDLVLLDLSLPRKDGRTVLAEIKADPDLKGIPVIVLTGSQAEQDINDCFDLQAVCYMCKPLVLDRFLQIISSIEDLTLTTGKAPSGRSGG